MLTKLATCLIIFMIVKIVNMESIRFCQHLSKIVHAITMQKSFRKGGYGNIWELMINGKPYYHIIILIICMILALLVAMKQ